MGLINGLSGLGAGLTAFAGAALDDEVSRSARASLLNNTPPPGEPAPVAAPPSAPAQAAQAALASTAAGPLKVPADLLPIYQAASKRTGIPVDVLVAQGKQESGFNPNAVGGAGEIGLHQIKPSTAANPGFGLRGIDPATLKDPAVNINFAADYLKARAGKGINFNDPAAVDAALKAYNSGGDPNYVRNVRQYMGASS